MWFHTGDNTQLICLYTCMYTKEKSQATIAVWPSPYDTQIHEHRSEGSLNKKYVVFPIERFPLKIRRSHDRLIFIKGISILVKHLYIETPPGWYYEDLCDVIANARIITSFPAKWLLLSLFYNFRDTEKWQHFRFSLISKNKKKDVIAQR